MAKRTFAVARLSAATAAAALALAETKQSSDMFGPSMQRPQLVAHETTPKESLP